MAKLILRKKGVPEVKIDLTSPVTTLGRSKGNIIVIRGDKKVSRHHSRLDYVDGEFFITDLRSANGTFCNDRLIRSRTRIKDGDKITIGDTELIFFSEGGILSGTFHDEKDLQLIEPEKTKADAGKTEETPQPLTLDEIKGMAPAPSGNDKPDDTSEKGGQTRKGLGLNLPDETTTTTCPKCGAVIDVSSIPKGAKVGCARCKHIFTV